MRLGIACLGEEVCEAQRSFPQQPECWDAGGALVSTGMEMSRNLQGLAMAFTSYDLSHLVTDCFLQSSSQILTDSYILLFHFLTLFVFIYFNPLNPYLFQKEAVLQLFTLMPAMPICTAGAVNYSPCPLSFVRLVNFLR